MNDDDDLNSMPTMRGGYESLEFGARGAESKGSFDEGVQSKELKNSGFAKSLSQYNIDTDVTIGPGRHEPREGFSVGDRIMDRYVVLSELGRGGMGVVYKCLDSLGKIEVALKALPPELSHDEGAMEDVRDNFAIVERLTHPNIANVKQIEFDRQTKTYYLIMELVQGETLKSYVRRKRKDGSEITLDEIVRILKQVASALDYAHAGKVLHRDVKPENIMIGANGDVKLLDFGLAYQIRSSMSKVTMVSQNASGTAAYMSPEQWRAKKQGPASDQYALGVIAYELLAGGLPFDSSDIAVLREAAINEEADSIEGIDKNVQAAILRALSKKANDRFASCSEFVDALAGKNSSEFGARSSELKDSAEYGVRSKESKESSELSDSSKFGARSSELKDSAEFEAADRERQREAEEEQLRVEALVAKATYEREDAERKAEEERLRSSAKELSAPGEGKGKSSIWKMLEIIWLCIAFFFIFGLSYDNRDFGPQSFWAATTGILYILLAGAGTRYCFLLGIASMYFCAILSPVDFHYLYDRVLMLSSVDCQIIPRFRYCQIMIVMMLVGFFTWKKKKRSDNTITMKCLASLGCLWCFSLCLIGIIMLAVISPTAGASDAIALYQSTIFVLPFAAMALAVMRYNEQWCLWAIVSALNILRAFENGLLVVNGLSLLSYIIYFITAIVFYFDWRARIKRRKVRKVESHL